MAAPTSSRLFIHVQNEEQYGPFLLRKNADVIECTRRILSQSFEREKLSIDGDICFELPRIPCDLEYALVVVNTAKENNTHVYVVEMKEEAVSLDEIRSFVYAVYGPSSFSKDSLRPYEEDKADHNSPEKVYTKGRVFRATRTHNKKTIEAPTNQPVMSPSQESSFSSSSSASREGPVVISPSGSLSIATAAESDQGVGQKTNPLVFHTPNEGKTSPATEQPLPGTLTAHEFKEKKAVSSVLSKSEMVAPQLATQNVFVGTPKHSSGAHANLNASSHLPQDKSDLERRSVEKEEDSVATYTADTGFDFAKDEEKTDKMEPKMSKNVIQTKVNFFENYFKMDTHKRPASSKERRGKMARPHRMAHKFMTSVHKERYLGFKATRTVKDGDIPQLGIRRKDPSTCIPDNNTCSAQLQSSESEEEKMDKVHALEHVYNNKCCIKTSCRKPPREESLQTVLRLKEAHCMGMLGPESAKLFKEYILVHCERCSNVNCRVPHMAAGCPHPRTVHAGQIHKGIATCINTESVSVTKNFKPDDDNIARFGSLDVSCKIPSTSGECQASAQLLSSEMKEEKAVSVSNRKELMDKAHILEHAYNKKCFLEAGCTNPPSAESLQQMSRMIEAYERGTLDHKAIQLFKEYISTHCERCNDVNCKIPHMAAGCPHPGIPQNLDPYLFNFTDGQQLVAQATDNDSPSTKNTVYLKTVKKPPKLKAESSAAGSDKQQSEEISSQSKNGKFLPLSVIRKQPSELNSLVPWLMYCSPTFSELTGLGFGSCVNNLFQETSYLGEGGNGQVYEWSYRLSGQKFASKHTRYRSQELNIWSHLDHENIISLYGVVLFHSSAWVYQLMPRITGSFQKEIEKIHTLCSLVQMQKLKNEPVGFIFKNVCYVYQKVAAGLNYLHHKGLVHGDIKASNILISKPPTCCCHSALLCTCQYKVFISDFDSVGHGCSASFLIRDRIIVLHPGTLFYRAPEAYLNIKGPWYDLWSVGCSLNHLILGRCSADVKKKAYGIGKSPTDIFSINPLLLLVVETCDAREQLVLLRDNLCKEYPEFDPLVRVISDCLSLDYTRRITASVLYEKFVLLYNN